MAEDIVQGIFVNLLNEPDNYADEEHLKYFLYKSIKNACINEVKKTSLRAKILDNISSDIEAEDDYDLFQTIVRAEVYQEILYAISNLPNKCGEVFRLAYLENLTNPEIAELLSISINTVKVQKNNAKKQLRERLGHLYPIVTLLFFL